MFLVSVYYYCQFFFKEKLMSYSFFEISQDNSVGIINLNNPPVNAFTLEMAKELDKILDDIAGDEAIKCVIITGNKRVFSAGADISSMENSDWEYLRELVRVGQEAFERLENMSKVVLAVIDGHCLGGAAELALACDRRFMATGKARIGLPEVKIGLMPAWGTSYRLPRLVGRSKALDLMIRGTLLSAEEALEIGLIDEMYSKEELMTKALEYANEISRGATFAISRIKKVINRSFDISFKESMLLECNSQKEVFATLDRKEGMRAFLEKRSPSFNGK